MIGLNKTSRKDKVRDVLLSAASHADTALRDKRLQDDLRSAADHGAAAASRLRKNAGLAGRINRLSEDRKLRKHVKALVEDLDSAHSRMRGKKTHRVRNVLVIVGLGSAVMAIPDVRRWVFAHVGANGTDTLATAT